MEARKRKYHSIQHLRGIAALLVVILHTYAFESKAGVGASLLPPWSVFGSSGVDLFFVISGFVMVLTTEEHSRVSLFLYRRISRIYPIYWLYTGLLALGYLLLPELIRRAGLAEVDYVSSFLLLPQQQLPLLVVGWTLIHEMYFYLVFALFLHFPRRMLPGLLTVWLLAIVLCSTFGGGISESPYYLLVSSPLTLEFIFGCYLALYLERLPGGGGVISICLAVGFLLLSWSIPWMRYGEDPLGLLRVLTLGVPYTLLLYVCVQTEVSTSADPAEEQSWLHSGLEQLGDASYSLYLSHFLVLSVLSRLYARGMTMIGPEDVSGMLDNVIFVALSLMVCVLFGLLSYRYVEKPLIRFFRNLLDRKRGEA